MSVLAGLLALILVVLIAVLLFRFLKTMIALVINAIVGVIFLWLINVLNLMSIVGRPDIPINLITVLICAIGGVFGVLITVILHLLGVPLTL
ncbi:pro-sigmaK processing inhibitor BofA family protein [Methanoculleus sp. 7T]|jgi:pro-sigmaK processing inhibitor BofA|uniref:pro-sigmaK processing inhibitor BofA family protein n=1 Tax=Methanoculleus sp. 7T TaxID=2937282 RepID=UPI0020C1273F|nr:pro-sigmaK processing inhibitor BofA family protein [Methanoculleus sp. 7T]MCK8518623.1 pro-sigmaK processing inhibitor BofA family protein [Methanoculleus sp. 7T]